MQGTVTLEDLLATQNCAEVARRLKRGRATVARWANGQGVPPASDIPELAQILRVDLALLTRIVARKAKELARSRVGVA